MLVPYTPDYRPQLNVAIQAAHEAARLIRMNAGRIVEDDVRDKGIHDIVTEIDEASQRLIVDILNRAFPDYTILAEEETEGTSAHGPTDGFRWIIDPIDGTTNFSRGIPPYAVSIGLQKEDQLVAGVVLDVARGELFTATRGGGLYVNGARASVSRTQHLSASIFTTGFPYRSFDKVDAYLQVMRGVMQETRALRRPGSASVDMAYVACGRFDGFFEVGLMPWDIAAGTLLIEEAGGRVTDFHDRPIDLFCGQMLATNGLLHRSALDLVEALR